MIRIVRLDEMPREEILKRELPAAKAEKAVSEIIGDFNVFSVDSKIHTRHLVSLY